MKRRASLQLLIIPLILLVSMIANTINAEELEQGLFKTVLDNGLTVLVKQTPGTKAATVQFWVKAGSVYEEPEEAGITHFIEHMIFKGTPERGPSVLASVIESVGGRINAYTSFEHTVYHATLTSRYWGLALDVLGDALLHSHFDEVEIEREKKVVLEELGMRNDRPNIMLFQELMSTAFSVHPYRLPVIGNVETISAFSREAILKYMDKHYHPENFTVLVVGDLQTDEVLKRVENLMGGLTKGGIKHPLLPQDTEQQEPSVFKVIGDIQQPQMALGFPITPFKHPDSPVLDVISEIVGHGETSRLYRSLRDEKGLVYGIHSSAFTPHDPGLFEIFATVDKSHMEQALEATLTELFILKYHNVSDEELVRAKLNLESDFIFNLERVEGQAGVLGSFEFMAGDPREDSYLEHIRNVTKEDILRVASEYFVSSHLSAGFLVSIDSAFQMKEKQLADILTAAEKSARFGETVTEVNSSVIDDVHKYVLPNGIRLLVKEEPTVPTVAIRAVFPGGLRYETLESNGAFAYINDVLPRGTVTMSAQEVATAVADMAGSLDGFNGKNTFGLKADFLSRFFRDGMMLFSEVIKNPAFNPVEIEKIKPELLAQIKQQEDSLPSLAFREFNRLLFDKHPYGLNVLGSEDSLTSLTAEELQKIYRQQAHPENLVLSVSGDVKAVEVVDLVSSLFGQWVDSEAEHSSPKIELPVLVEKPIVYDITRDKEQVHIIIGFLGTTLTSQDRYGLEVLDTLLSGQSGRLFTELRDNLSLAYSLSSFSLMGIDTGSFGIYIGTSPDKKDKTIEEIWKQLERVRQEAPRENELERAKNIIISQYEMGLQTHGAQAMDMALNESYDLGQDFGDRYIESIAKVDGAAVLAAAQKFILPQGHVMVTVGAEKEN